MLPGYSGVTQGILGTLFTWFVTALGAAVVFVVPPMSEENEGKFLDGCLGFSSGVMLAASYWSLLAPAVELAEESGYGRLSFFPAALGFILGAVTVWTADKFLPDTDNIHEFLISDSDDAETHNLKKKKKSDDLDIINNESGSNSKNGNSSSHLRDGLRQRKVIESEGKSNSISAAEKEVMERSSRSWRRVLLLVIAMTIHNFPEGLAVGVAFGSIGKSPSATFSAAVALAIGIGLQNFPEGLAVSLPMHREKRTKMNSFFWGQMSGAVEPIGGFLGAAMVEYAEWFLPYALAFAAGAMVYVVVDSIVPEAQVRGNGKYSSWGAVVGFVLMMVLDVALG
mmetsp:Transcript_21585/g.27585  ORF Transcript_21585/g.27585 Transcript_21585/m.27585 type:complete len:339 (+) Transcript_21585:99-1115(+)|eukprot:CAMPEP_0204831076 /NCGR_PEP_ID=MMETSP1346-20131115/9789_1 /ASSEMBLY_ACC=CAM_ASM_000771 /TAXON_ID=215587 /ORGANISM="Aplanochytrium stocchinoi, Strain GSBS06" /LENGTH=338 /DNA_ID=CAMNT_0051961799 /DNA_START=152 /DNA_END=1168 /DNA_ORIENTATION=+